MGFNLENYEQIKDRIARFYSDHKDGRILTDLVTPISDIAGSACFKASVYIGDVLKATGYAYEQQGQGVNRDAWVENSETSAIGRALANMDYCGTLRPSREEMSKVGNEREEKPKDPRQVAMEKLTILMRNQPEKTKAEYRARITKETTAQDIVDMCGELETLTLNFGSR